MIIKLNGYSQDRTMSTLARLLIANSYEMVDGYFTWSSFVSDEDVSVEVSSIISDHFASKPLDEAKSLVKLALTSILAEISPSLFADGDVNKMELIYKTKQEEVHRVIGVRETPKDWASVAVTAMCEDEHADRLSRGVDWAIGLGVKMHTPQPIDLFKVWWLNTWMADWLQSKADLVRQQYGDVIDAATDVSEIENLPEQYKLEVLTSISQTGEFSTSVAPLIISSSGLTIL